MRAGLLVAHFELPVQIVETTMYSDAFTALQARNAPARTVPALALPEGPVISESLAIAEELATRFPDRDLWPPASGPRAVARMLAAEMHASFVALRKVCAMNLRRAYRDVPLEDAVLRDLARLEEIWSWARAQTGSPGPWLCGDYCVADAFFAPVAARIAGHTLPVGPKAAAYTAAHLADPSFRAWRARALVEGPDQSVYDRPWPQVPWPDPATP